MNNAIWDPYKNLLGAEVIDQLFQSARLLDGKKIVHVSSTRQGGGVSEILNKMVPLFAGLGLETRWEILEGNESFFQCTKLFHNLLQGSASHRLNDTMLKTWVDTNKKNAEKLAPLLQDADFVLIHDPQPLSLIDHFPNRKGKWIWRCHIDTSLAQRMIWKYLRPHIDRFDASIFSLENYNQLFPHPVFVIPPSIDPFSEKNIELDLEEISEVLKRFGIDSSRPIVLQVSRFDIFKDPIGVIRAYRLVKRYKRGLQLVLAGGGAPDDPEGNAMLQEVQLAAEGDPDIHVLYLPSDSPRIINALQRAADIILQKSTREGFGLTVAEALWKMKPVIAGDTGGIRVQVMNHYTGLLVHTPEGAANRLRYLLQSPETGKNFGVAGKRLVKENFLITRHLRDYLTMMSILIHPPGDRIILSGKPGPEPGPKPEQ